MLRDVCVKVKSNCKTKHFSPSNSGRINKSFSILFPIMFERLKVQQDYVQVIFVLAIKNEVTVCEPFYMLCTCILTHL